MIAGNILNAKSQARRPGFLRLGGIENRVPPLSEVHVEPENQGVQVIVAVSLGVPLAKTEEAFEHTGKLPESDELEATVGQLGFWA